MKPEEWPLPYLPYFCHEALAHDWPPGWLPGEWGRDETAASLLAREAREKQVALGNMGTIGGLSDKSDKRSASTSAPKWMKP